MPDFERFIPYIESLHETRSIEYKESVPWGVIQQKIAKTAMAMANIRDGGVIIVGVTKTGNSYERKGISHEHLETYKEDEVLAYVNSFADPYVRLEIEPFEWNGREFLAIVVHEFDEVPVVCKKDSSFTRKGAIYTRSHRMAETCEVRDQTEMREILEMAAEKDLSRFISRSQRAGISLIPPGNEVTDRELLDNQIGRFTENIASELPIPILDKPHWAVIIKPQTFELERIPSLPECWKLIDTCRVSLGSFYPLIISEKEHRQNGNDWIASWGQIFVSGREVYWRLYQSAQFLHYFSFWEDGDPVLEDIAKTIISYQGTDFTPSGYVDIIYTLYVISESLEFAARLAQKGIFGKSVTIAIKMIGINKRMLLDRYSDILIRTIHSSSENNIGKEWTFEVENLISRTPDLALDIATWFYQRFGLLDPPLSFLKDKQSKFLNRKS